MVKHRVILTVVLLTMFAGVGGVIAFHQYESANRPHVHSRMKNIGLAIQNDHDANRLPVGQDVTK